MYWVVAEMKKIFDKPSKMNTAIFMSGNGEAVRKIIENGKSAKAHYKVSVIFTDNIKMNNDAKAISSEFMLPLELNDREDFYLSMGKDNGDMSIRPEYFKNLLKKLERYKIDAIMLVDYMTIITEPLLGRYKNRIINLHHADLSKRDYLGKAKYTGSDPVSAAILDGQKYIRSTTHLVVADIDQGAPLLISKPIEINLPQGVTRKTLVMSSNDELRQSITKEYEELLRINCDPMLCIQTLESIATGLFMVDDNGLVYLNNKKLTYGKKLSSKNR